MLRQARPMTKYPSENDISDQAQALRRWLKRSPGPLPVQFIGSLASGQEQWMGPSLLWACGVPHPSMTGQCPGLGILFLPSAWQGLPCCQQVGHPA